MYEKKLLLDTYSLLWLVSGSKEISAPTLKSIENCSIVYVSGISAWEISLKYEKGSITLPVLPEKWFYSVLENHTLTLVPLDVDILIQANKLPWHHKDPADRFIIATAMRENAAVVTADKRFKKYDVKVII